MSIWKENYQLMQQLRNFSIAYCEFVEAGGRIGDVSNALINKAIACAVKIKENRDFVEVCSGREIPSVPLECAIASNILRETYAITN